ncbi:MAG: ATP synthase F1 subunit delta, partial [Schleiferiaceae bacterium]
MNYPRVASRYSKALLDLAVEQNMLDQAQADAQSMTKAIAESKELEQLLKSPIVKADKKQAILKEIFGGKFSSLFEGFVMLLTKNGR